jgi:hypothetical protein
VQPVIRFALLGLLFVAMAAGCGAPGYEKNAAGSEAGAKKEYTKDDARAAMPQRGGSDKSDE